MSKRFQGGVLGVGFNPLQAPNAPTGVTGTAGSGQVSVAFTAPTNVGGSAISSYVAKSNPGNFSNTGASSPIVVSGLTNGTSYTFQVTALNSYGPSPISAASGSVTPSDPNWIGMIVGTGNGSAGSGIEVDSTGNIYVGGFISGPTSYLAKISSAGAIQWQRTITGASNQSQALGIDSSANVYITSQATFGGYSQTFTAKYNTSGALQWQRVVRGRTSDDLGVYRAYTQTSSGDTVFVGSVSYTQTWGSMGKIDTNGSVSFWTTLEAGGYYPYLFGAYVDTSGNIYANSGLLDPCIGNYQAALMKYNSSGSLQWSRVYGSTSYGAYGQAVVTDSSGNVYAVGVQSNGGWAAAYLIKYDSSGTLQWQRALGSAGSQVYAYDMAIDASDNIYFCGQIVNDGLLAKYNSSGTLQWQRRFISSGGSSSFRRVKAAGTSVYVTGLTNNSSAGTIFVGKFKQDGSGTGSYTLSGVTCTYQAATATSSTPSLANSTQSYVATTRTSTTTTSTYTDGAGSYTLSTVNT